MGILDWRGLKCWDLLDWNGLGNVGNGMLDWLDGVCWIKYLGYVRRGMMDWMGGLCMIKWLGYVGLYWLGMLDW